MNELTEEQKLNSVKEFTEFTAQHVLTFFKMLNLKTHIECQLFNEPTNERFIFRFFKVGENYLPKQDELAFDNLRLVKELNDAQSEIDSLKEQLQTVLNVINNSEQFLSPESTLKDIKTILSKDLEK